MKIELLSSRINVFSFGFFSRLGIFDYGNCLVLVHCEEIIIQLIYLMMRLYVRVYACIVQCCLRFHEALKEVK